MQSEENQAKRKRIVRRVSSRPKRVYKSFTRFCAGGEGRLAGLKPGRTDRFQTRANRFCVLRENDFQELIGLARDADRLSGRLGDVLEAVRAAKHDWNEDTENALKKAVALLGDAEVLPTSSKFKSRDREKSPPTGEFGSNSPSLTFPAAEEDEAVFTFIQELVTHLTAANVTTAEQKTALLELAMAAARLPETTPQAAWRFGLAFGDANHSHYWQVLLNEQELIVESGGSVYDAAVGGDSYHLRR